MILRLLPILAAPFLLALNPQQAGDASAAPPAAESAKPEMPADKPAEPAPVPVGVDVPEGFEWKLWAREPLVADPVSFTVLNDGSLMVVESSRQERGIEDNRYSSWWLLDDLRSRTIEDRLAMYKKWAGKRVNGMDWYTQYADRVKHVMDTNGAGVANFAVNFSGELNEPLDGTAAGVLQVGNSIFVTCIPNLWRFQDQDGKGVAQVREKMFTGFGVKVSLRGHDMHGLALGMDGRLYWSIGDRGYSVRSKEGALLEDAGRGAVFRCDLDGSNLEVFFRGLRNPQELAFNDFGDLFTVDNNSDASDKARVQYLPDGGDAGWEMHYQTLEGDNQRGPWQQEHVWYLFDPADLVQPAWITPPTAHLTSGPSGLVAYPGVGFPEKFNGSMFVCDFLGTPAGSQVWSFKVTPKGAGYEMSDAEIFVKNFLPTDVDFAPDGSMFVSDWVDGWGSKDAGRIYRIWQPEGLEKARAAGGADILRRGGRGAGDSNDRLLKWLDHPDRRVRQMAHLALAARAGEGEVGALAKLAGDSGAAQRARLHALWSLGVIARQKGGTAVGDKACAALIALTTDSDAEIKTQAARALGDVKGDALRAKAAEALRPLTLDESTRVRAFACAALGRLRDKEAAANLSAVLWENDNQDPWLRQAAATALARIGDKEKLDVMASDQFPRVRLGALLALRQMRDPGISRLLFDADPAIALEAARAIYDLNIADQMPALAALGDRFCGAGSQGGVGAFTPQDVRTLPLLRRVIAANRLLADAAAVNRLAELAQSLQISPAARKLALEALAEWAAPEPREPVHGRVIDIAPESRNRDAWKHALAVALPAIATSSPDEALRERARELAGKAGIALDSAAALKIALDANANPRERAGCLRQLAQEHNPQLQSAIDAALASSSPLLRADARSILATENPGKAIELLRKAAASGELSEQQAAITALAAMTDAAAAEALKPLAQQLAQGTLPPSVQLEVVQACMARKEPVFAESLAEWKKKFPSTDPFELFNACVEGGDAERGQRIVSSNSASQCLRCHSIAGAGGHAGPSLEGVAARYDRRGLLESLVSPNAKIAPGFGPVSAMPTMTVLLSPRELRDVVAYLSTLKPGAAP